MEAGPFPMARLHLVEERSETSSTWLTRSGPAVRLTNQGCVVDRLHGRRDAISASLAEAEGQFRADRVTDSRSQRETSAHCFGTLFLAGVLAATFPSVVFFLIFFFLPPPSRQTVLTAPVQPGNVKLKTSDKRQANGSNPGKEVVGCSIRIRKRTEGRIQGPMDLQGTRCYPVAAAANVTMEGARLGGERSRGRAALGDKKVGSEWPAGRPCARLCRSLYSQTLYSRMAPRACPEETTSE